MMKMALAAGTLLLSLTQSGWAAPVCSSPGADPDNDGWGWENGDSCRMPDGPDAPQTENSLCFDTDPVGDGWGWDGVGSCRVVAQNEPVLPMQPAQPVSTAERCIDTDPVGDGWGWDGVSSCRVVEEVVPTSEPDSTSTAASCIDTDPVGDGWGWDGMSSCRVVDPVESTVQSADPSASGCIDTDPVGDGWGWDGTQSCRVEDARVQSADAVEPEVAAAASDCVDTDPVGDGWGWNGSTSCQIEDAVTEVTLVPDSSTAAEPDALVCIDTNPLNDGWGWNGVTSCRVEPTQSAEPAPVAVVSSQAWTPVNSVDGSHATGRHESGAVALNDKIYLLGGRGNRPVDVYDRAANKWYQLGNLPMEMHHFQPVALNGKIYVIGAMTCCFPNESTIDNVWIMDATTGDWEAGAAIPADRRRGSAAAVVYNDRIYIVGGNTRGHSGGAVAWFDEFDPATGNWRALADAPNARDHAGAAIVAGRLVISSGRRTSQPDTFGNTVAATDVYDFANGKWSAASAIPTQRGGAMFAAIGNEYLVIGGESNTHFNAHAEVEAFDVTSGSWRRLPSLLTGRHSGGAAVLSDGVHVVAGASNRGGGSEISSHEKLSP
jgi:hypothetical protein